MLKQITQLEHKIGDKVYQFICGSDAPLGECHDAIMAMKDFIVKKIMEVHDAQKPKDPEPPVEEKKDG